VGAGQPYEVVLAENHHRLIGVLLRGTEADDAHQPEGEAQQDHEGGARDHAPPYDGEIDRINSRRGLGRRLVGWLFQISSRFPRMPILAQYLNYVRCLNEV